MTLHKMADSKKPAIKKRVKPRSRKCSESKAGESADEAKAEEEKPENFDWYVNELFSLLHVSKTKWSYYCYHACVIAIEISSSLLLNQSKIQQDTLAS